MAGRPLTSHIFVSHATEDKVAADTVVRSLEAGHLRCWIAPRDIAPGQSWMGAIVKGIVDSGLMVVLVSRSSVASRNVLREMTIADDEQVPLIHITLSNAIFQMTFASS